MNKNDFGYMPDLSGSDAQIKWANAIRDNLIEKLNLQRKPELADLALRIVRDYVNKHTSAHFWIENRYEHQRTIVDAVEKAHAAGEHLIPEDIKRVAAAEATITPENNTKPGVVEINITENTISATYVKDEDFRAIVKKMGYTWNGQKAAWEREFDKYRGPVSDRAAELGNKLLNAGFAVRIWDEKIRNRAITADFLPEQDKWVKLRIDGEYEDWLDISWDGRNDVLYNAARAIKGSRWDKGAVVVKIEYADMVEDFASLYGFSISDRARRAIDEYLASLAPAVKIEQAPDVPDIGDPLNDILNSSREVIDDLKDED
jgi:hypothetical protein